MVICIETATSICSVALCDRNGVTGLRESTDLKSHAASLTVFIDELLKENGLKVSELEAVAAGRGPGSYTGLRIGVSVAKGLSFGAGIPLIAIDTTLSMFRGARALFPGIKDEDPVLFCPMLDARRMEVYCALYDGAGKTVRNIAAEILTGDSFQDIPEEVKIIMFGDGASKAKELLHRKNVIFADDFRISASHLQKDAYEALDEKRFEDVAYFEPFYLKDFITSTPRKNVLGK